MGHLVDDVQLLDGDLVDLVEHIDAWEIDPGGGEEEEQEEVVSRGGGLWATAQKGQSNCNRFICP